MVQNKIKKSAILVEFYDELAVEMDELLEICLNSNIEELKLNPNKEKYLKQFENCKKTKGFFNNEKYCEYYEKSPIKNKKKKFDKINANKLKKYLKLKYLNNTSSYCEKTLFSMFDNVNYNLKLLSRLK